MDERYIDVSYDEDNGLRLMDALEAVRRNILVCMLAGLVAAGAFLAYTILCIAPQYQSSFTIYVSNRPDIEEVPAEELIAGYYLSLDDIHASYSLAKTYAYIIESPEMALSAVQHADLSSYEERVYSGKLVSTSIEQETPLLTVTATADSPQDARKLSEAVLSLIPDRAASIYSEGSMSVVESPMTPARQSSPSNKLNAAIGFLLGFALAALFVAVRDDRNKLVRDKDELESRFGAPAFVDVQDTLPLLPRQAVRTVGITDAQDGNLAAADAIALAESYAAQGAHVLLVDGDANNAACQKQLGVRQAAGLSDVLSGNTATSDAVQPLSDRGIDFMSSGRHANDFARTAKGAKIGSLLADLERDYDCVVVALPSMRTDTSALVLAGRTNRTFLSVRAGKTRRPDVAEALRRLKLADVRIDGFIYSEPQSRMGRLTARKG